MENTFKNSNFLLVSTRSIQAEFIKHNSKNATIQFGFKVYA